MELRRNSNNKFLEIPTTNENAVFSLMANDKRSSVSNESVFPYIFLQAGDARSSIFYGKDNFLNFSINPKAPSNSSTFSYSNGFRFINSNGADITNQGNSPAYGNELMRITKEGNVGIATQSPLSKLHVAGDFRIQSYVSGYDNIWDNFIIHTDDRSTNLTSNGDENGMFLSSATGNKITIGDNNDNVSINSKKLIFDYGEENDLAQVSINTDKQVTHAALTVAGATYIGPKADLAAVGSLLKFKPEYLDKYSLWVENGIVSEDFAFANVAAWKDDVFNADYDLMSLEEVKSHIEQNKHLPNVPSEKSIKEKGYTAHQMNMIFMQKIEELTLHTISLNEKIKVLEEKLTDLKNK
ncbi:hypothetical protein [Chryseobacterium sp. OSA05B]|uniref:hypothetical protein n=1 Tax=Chryseobacterium sp. OSA05B TaxID=2862650 RepID=UPI001CC141F5|nr:hypothetical protein [Chryseobacterium sp. OSA05B]